MVDGKKSSPKSKVSGFEVRSLQLDIAEDIEVMPGGSVSFEQDLHIEEDEHVEVVEEDEQE